jgi:hypothetical protein
MGFNIDQCAGKTWKVCDSKINMHAMTSRVLRCYIYMYIYIHKLSKEMLRKQRSYLYRLFHSSPNKRGAVEWRKVETIKLQFREEKGIK